MRIDIKILTVLFRKKTLLVALLSAFILLLVNILKINSDLIAWISAIPSVLLLTIYAYYIGINLLKLFKYRIENDRFFHFIAILLGYGFITITILGIVTIGLVKFLIPILILILFVLFILNQIYKKEDYTILYLSSIPEDSSYNEKRLKIDTIIRVYSFVVFVLVLICLFMFTLIPESFHDSLLYHLALPEQVLVTGKLIPMSHNFTNYLPLGTEMLYFPLGANDYSCRLLELSFALIAAGLIINFYKQKKEPGTVLLAILPFCFLEFFFSSITTLVEINVLAYAAAGWFLLEEFFKTNSKINLILSGLMIGFASGTKAQGLVMFAIFFVILATQSLKDKKRPREILFKALLFSIPVLVIYLPWLVRSTLLTGNPFFPAFASIFKSKVISQVDNEFILNIWGQASEGVKTFPGFFKHLFYLFFTSGKLGVFIPGIIISLFTIKTNLWKNLRVFIAFILFYIIWFFIAPNPRYLTPAIFLLVILSINAIHILRSNTRLMVAGYLLIIFIFFLNLFPVIHAMNDALRPGNFYSKGLKRDLYQKGIINYPLDAYKYLNTNTPADSNILLIGESRGYGLKRKYHASSPYETQLITDLITQSNNQHQLRSLINKYGFSHLMINYKEWSRMRNILKLPTMLIMKNSAEKDIFYQFINSLPLIYRDNTCVIYNIN